MKRFKIWFLLIVLLVPTLVLSGCQSQSVTKRSNSADTWSKIKKRGTVVIGLDDSFVPMGFRQKKWEIGWL